MQLRQHSTHRFFAAQSLQLDLSTQLLLPELLICFGRSFTLSFHLMTSQVWHPNPSMRPGVHGTQFTYPYPPTVPESPDGAAGQTSGMLRNTRSHHYGCEVCGGVVDVDLRQGTSSGLDVVHLRYKPAVSAANREVVAEKVAVESGTPDTRQSVGELSASRRLQHVTLP